MARVLVLQTKDGCATHSTAALNTVLSRARAMGQTFVANTHTGRGSTFETIYRTDGESRPGDRPLTETQLRAWDARAHNCGPGIAPVAAPAAAAPSPPITPGSDNMQIPAVPMTRGKTTIMAPPSAQFGLGDIFGGIGSLAKRIIPGGIDDAIIDFATDKLKPKGNGAQPLTGGSLGGGPCPFGSVNIGGTCRSLGPGVNAGPAAGGQPGSSPGPTAAPGPNWQSVKVGNRTAFVPQVNQVQVRDCPPGYKINDKDGLCYHSTRHGTRKRTTRKKTHSHSHSHRSSSRRSRKCWAKYKGKCYSKAQAKAGFAGPRNKAKARGR